MLRRGELSGHALVSWDGSGLESDPGTRLSCFSPVISEGLRGRDEALIRPALASPFLFLSTFKCSQSPEKIVRDFFAEAKAKMPVLLFCAS